MNRRLLGAALIGGALALIYVARPGEPGPATHVATCPVRIDDDCRAELADAGIAVRRYERIRVPVVRDGGADYTLPPGFVRGLRQCIEVMDWSDCTLEPAASRPAVAALWSDPMPARIAGATRKCRRAKPDAGACTLADGGDPGWWNVLPAAAMSGAGCEPVECVVYAGEEGGL